MIIKVPQIAMGPFLAYQPQRSCWDIPDIGKCEWFWQRFGRGEGSGRRRRRGKVDLYWSAFWDADEGQGTDCVCRLGRGEFLIIDLYFVNSPYEYYTSCLERGEAI